MKKIINLKLILFIASALCFYTISFAQEENILQKYRLSNNYAPHVLDCYVVTYRDGTSKILNKETGKYYKDTYQFFQTDNNNYWGLSGDFWHFGQTDSVLVKIKIPKANIDSLQYLGIGHYLAFSKGKKILNIDIWKSTYKFIECDDFISVECGELDKTIITSKRIQGKVKYGCLSLKTGKFISDIFVDSIITCPRTFDEIALVFYNGKYQFYDFINNQSFGKKYISYKQIPIYNTAMGIYENGIEIMDNKQIYNFELGKVLGVEFENEGDYVYAIISTDKGIVKIDIWDKIIIKN